MEVEDEQKSFKHSSGEQIQILEQKSVIAEGNGCMLEVAYATKFAFQSKKYVFFYIKYRKPDNRMKQCWIQTSVRSQE